MKLLVVLLWKMQRLLVCLDFGCIHTQITKIFSRHDIFGLHTFRTQSYTNSRTYARAYFHLWMSPWLGLLLTNVILMVLSGKLLGGAQTALMGNLSCSFLLFMNVSLLFLDENWLDSIIRSIHLSSSYFLP